MDTQTVIWIVVAVVVVVAVAALLATLGNRRRTEGRRTRAGELRTEATGLTGSVQDTRLEADQAEAEAQRARAQAEQAEARAGDAHRAAEQSQAAYEDRVREADRLDPDVDHRAADYRPGTPGPAGQEGQAPVATEEELEDGGTHRA